MPSSNSSNFVLAIDVLALYWWFLSGDLVLYLEHGPNQQRIIKKMPLPGYYIRWERVHGKEELCCTFVACNWFVTIGRPCMYLTACGCHLLWDISYIQWIFLQETCRNYFVEGWRRWGLYCVLHCTILLMVKQANNVE